MPQSVGKLLRNAQRHISAGESAQAEEILRDIFSQFPKNNKARQLYQKLKTPPQVDLDKLINLYNAGRLKETIKFGQALANKFPNAPILYEILGAANLGLGHTNETMRVYTRLLRLNPKHSDAFNNLGIIFYRQGDFAKSIENYQKAIEIEPNFADAHYNLANALTQIGHLKEAVQSYRKSLEINPNDAEVLTNYGRALKSYGSFEQAIECYKKVLKVNSSLPGIQAEIDEILTEKANFNRVLDIFKQRSENKLSPAEFDFFHGSVYNIMGYSAAALDNFKKAIRHKSDYAEPYHSIGKLMQDAGQIDSAIENYREAIKINPELEETYYSLGGALRAIDKFTEAKENYKTAIKINPNFAEAFNALGSLQIKLEHLDAAIINFKQAIKIKPDYSSAFNNLGVAQLDTGDIKIAMRSFRQALEIEPNHPEYHLNVGNAFRDSGDLDLALESYQEAIKIDPDYAPVHWNQSLLYLTLEDFQNGWPKYDYRWEGSEIFAGKFISSSKPVWRPGRKERILLWPEQGLGDEIMFASMIPDLQLLSSKLIVQVDKRLIPLFRRSFSGNIDILPKDEPIPEKYFDAHIPMGSLPQYFRQNKQEFKNASRGWLTASNVKTNDLRQKLLEGKPEIIIGISWHSTKPRRGAASKVISLAQMAKALHGQKVKLVNLQYGDVNQELNMLKEETGIDVIQLPEININDDIDGLAALIMACDRVVSISNVTIHLAGALGKQAHVLLASSSDWRWGQQSDTNFWYDSVCLHRQTKINDWKTVLEQL